MQKFYSGMRCPKKLVKDDFFTCHHFLNFLKCPISKNFAVNFIFPFFSVNPIFLCQPQFSLSIPNFPCQSTPFSLSILQTHWIRQNKPIVYGPQTYYRLIGRNFEQFINHPIEKTFKHGADIFYSFKKEWEVNSWNYKKN